MRRDVELSGGPLAGSRWPVRLEADQTLWIGIGTDGREYDGRSRLQAIAIYERTGTEDRPRFDFARLEGPGERIAELGRRITRLRANWAHHSPTMLSSQTRLTGPSATTHPPPAAPTAEASADTGQIARRVFERWLGALEALPARTSSDDAKVCVSMIVPGEAEQLRDLLECNGVTAALIRTTVEVRRTNGDKVETLETGAVEIAAADIDESISLLRRMRAAV